MTAPLLLFTLLSTLASTLAPTLAPTPPEPENAHAGPNSPSSPAPRARPALAITRAAGDAWAVIDGGQLWVCWQPSPRCFERVVLPEHEQEQEQEPRPETETELERGAVEPTDSAGFEPVHAHSALDNLAADTTWRLGFEGDTLWVSLAGARWRVERDQRRATAVSVTGLALGGATDGPLTAPSRHRCGPRGQVPAFIGAALGWALAPTCAAAPARQTCLAPPAPRVRQPRPLRVRAGLTVQSTRGWAAVRPATADETVSPGQLRLRADLTVVATVEFAFNPRGGSAPRLARQRVRARALPAITPGPLAQREHAALLRVICGAEPVQ